MVGVHFVNNVRTTSPSWAIHLLSKTFTGYDMYTGKFDFNNLRWGLAPIVIGMVAHKVAGVLGANKALAKSGIPVIRI
jgi:hypothetical protein